MAAMRDSTISGTEMVSWALPRGQKIGVVVAYQDGMLSARALPSCRRPAKLPQHHRADLEQARKKASVLAQVALSTAGRGGRMLDGQHLAHGAAVNGRTNGPCRSQCIDELQASSAICATE